MRIDVDKIIDFLDIAYDGQRDPETWRSDVLDASMTIVVAASGAWFDFDARVDEQDVFRLHSLTRRVLRGDHVREPSSKGAAWTKLAPEILESLFGRSLAMTFTSLVGNRAPSDIAAWRDVWRGPIVDNLGIIARDPRGMGALVVSGVTEAVRPTRRENRLLDRVSFHFAAAARLRSRERPANLEAAEAVLTPNGKILHATATAQNKSDSLEDGRRRRDHARQSKHDPEKALEVWKGLIAGRWSLVDHVDTDGKRFLLAMKNPPPVDRRADLTPRERRVCAFVAMGHRDKEIAYMLGLSLASVTASLHRARRKLNVQSRSDLAKEWRARTIVPVTKK